MLQESQGLESKETKKLYQILNCQIMKLFSALQKVQMVELCCTLKNDTFYKVANGLKMYKGKNSESVFLEIINPNTANIVLGYVHHHPTIEANKFIEHFIGSLNEKLLLNKLY